MPRMYQAVLHGDRVEWIDRAPDRSRPISVQITVLTENDERSLAERGRLMAEALEALASTGSFIDLTDPVEWQRDVRRDRALPGRKI